MGDDYKRSVRVKRVNSWSVGDIVECDYEGGVAVGKIIRFNVYRDVFTIDGSNLIDTNVGYSGMATDKLVGTATVNLFPLDRDAIVKVDIKSLRKTVSSKIAEKYDDPQ